MTAAPREVAGKVERVERKEPPEPEGWMLLAWTDDSYWETLTGGVCETKEAALSNKMDDGAAYRLVRIDTRPDSAPSPQSGKVSEDALAGLSDLELYADGHPDEMTDPNPHRAIARIRRALSSHAGGAVEVPREAIAQAAKELRAAGHRVENDPAWKHNKPAAEGSAQPYYDQAREIERWLSAPATASVGAKEGEAVPHTCAEIHVIKQQNGNVLGSFVCKQPFGHAGNHYAENEAGATSSWPNTGARGGRCPSCDFEPQHGHFEGCALAQPSARAEGASAEVLNAWNRFAAFGHYKEREKDMKTVAEFLSGSVEGKR